MTSRSQNASISSLIYGNFVVLHFETIKDFFKLIYKMPNDYITFILDLLD